ncbi:trimeric intracellular cation channel family protein [Pedobacter sp.]|uniref:trimeric intracellular cation channel family protein n=1 Tax=Pedobacter sp. TaxID=1411316 RepID=UPI003D7FAC4F
MDSLHNIYYFIELAGTFAFAISGATASRQQGLDLFGICAVAFTVACGGGIIRDVCIGAIPPAGLTNWYYLVASIAASALTIGLFPLVQRLNHPVLLFDALGLALFAVTGSQKTLSYGHNAQMAIILGVTTAVGGGVLRDVLLNRVPVILRKEIYASAAIIGAAIVVLGNYWNLPGDWVAVFSLVTCFTIRILALYYHWNLPSSGPIERKD